MTEFKFLLLSEYESSSVYKYLSSIGSTKLMSGRLNQNIYLNLIGLFHMVINT